ncbi:MAG: hypothetical protein JJ897_00690 [Marinibacterium sp.]|nr:hypothetical protein [Marinibacterium sp.]
MVHLWPLKDQVQPPALHPFFVQPGIGEIKFHVQVFFVQWQFPHDLFGVGPVFDVDAGENLQRFFGLHNRVDTDQVAFLQTMQRLLGQFDHQRQKRPVKLEHVHAHAEWGKVLFPSIAQLAQSQFGKLTIVE